MVVGVIQHIRNVVGEEKSGCWLSTVAIFCLVAIYQFKVTAKLVLYEII